MIDVSRRLAFALVLASTALARAQPLATTPPPPEEEEQEPKRVTPFDRGKFGLGFGFGAQTSLGADYYYVSGGVGYYVLDGVEVGLGLGHQWGDGPSITRTTPSLRYVAQPLVGTSPLIPYIGVFGSRYFIADGFDDVNTLGGRVGALYISGSLLLGLGLAVERIVSDCEMDCTSYYPDFTLSLSL